MAAPYSMDLWERVVEAVEVEGYRVTRLRPASMFLSGLAAEALPGR